MQKFKDKNNNVHEIEAGFENLLPEGSVEITQAEADTLLAPTTQDIEVKRKTDIKNEGVRRIQIIFPFFVNLDDIDFISEFWKSIDVSVRNPTVKFQSAINIYGAAMAAITNDTLLNDVVWP